jgi:hypothetical protein
MSDLGEPRRHDGETLKQAFDRLSDNIEDPFDRHRNSRNRYGWKDLLFGHALTNVFVTLARERPQQAGYLLLAAAVGMLVLVVLLLTCLAWMV